MLKKDAPLLWIYDSFNPFEVHKFAIKGTIFQGYSGMQEIVIAESHCFGRCLILDNEFQSFEVDEFIYHEALVQPALILHPMPNKVAIIGGGEGATLREVLRHKDVKRSVMVEIDKKVVECAIKHLPSFHNGSFSDERTTLIYKDGRKFIEETNETYDVIIVDLTCPLEGGSSYKLFTQEFYELVKNKLTPQGLFSVQASGLSPIALSTYTVINRTLKEVFPKVFPYAAYVPSYAMVWGFYLATNGLNPTHITKEDIDRRISDKINGKLRFYDGTTHQALFNLPKHVRKALSKQNHINRDNKPHMEKYPWFDKQIIS